MKKKRHAVSLSRNDNALVMASLSDYVDVLDSPMNMVSFIPDEDKHRLRRISNRMMNTLLRPSSKKPKGGE